ncbi:Strn4 [Symbiodinium sp. CCMP2456]|nr:Strn4 [Symbiodinium sp. CCMP2456]
MGGFEVSGEAHQLLAEAEIYCRQQGRSGSARSSARDLLAGKIASTEERLRMVRQRNEELQVLARNLEEALNSCRRHSARSLGGQLFSGSGPCGLPEELPEISLAKDWRQLALCIPRMRKALEAPLGPVSKVEGSRLRFQELPPEARASRSGDAIHSQAAKESGVASDAAFGIVAVLHSHLDGVRSARLTRRALLTAGEDASIRAWDLTGISRLQPGPEPYEDLEPFASYRAHSGPVLALAVPDSEDGELFYSGGMDGDIFSWQMLSPGGVEDCRQAGQHQRLRGHRDAVWCLDLQQRLGLLASAGGDKLVLLWKVNTGQQQGGLVSEPQVVELPPVNGLEHSFGPPTGLAWGPRDKAVLLCASSWASSCCAMDVERGAPIYGGAAVTHDDPVLCLASHALRDIAVSGHGGCARVFCPLTGRSLWSLQRMNRLAQVSSVAMDPFGAGHEVVTGGQDGRLEIFDLRTCRCMQEVQLPPREDTTIHSVQLQGDTVAAACADATVTLLARKRPRTPV